MDLNSIIGKLKGSFVDNWNGFIEKVPSIILAVVIIAAGVLLANFIAKTFRKTIFKKAHDPLMANFLTKTIKIAFIFLIIIFALRVIGLGGIAASLMASLGASAVIFGFAFKDIGENFISGIILSFSRPFNVNDLIKIGDVYGRIISMQIRYTKIRTLDGRDVYVPNSNIIKSPVYNYTEDGFNRLDFIVGIAYENDIKRAKQIILKTVQDTFGVIEDEEHNSFILVDELATSTVNLKVHFWVKTIEYSLNSIYVKSDVMANVKNALDANKISMPADVKEIKLYGNQTSFPITIKSEEKNDPVIPSQISP